MGMLRASPFDIRLTAGPPHTVKVRRGRHGKIDSHATRQLNTDRSIAPRDMGNEWDVVQQAIAGNADAYDRLIAARTGRLIRTAFAVLRNKEDAEDALQDGLLSAYSRLHSFEGRSSFSSWLTRIVINAALMIRRRNNTHPEPSLDEILESQRERLPHGAVDPRSDPEKLYAAKEIQALVERQVRKLPPKLQQAYRLRAINGLSAAESARALGIPPSVSKSRIFHARRKLTNALQESA